MARLMLSAGMLTDLALSTAVRRRGLEPGSPPPRRAAMDISRMILVKIFPRLASSAPFLCLMECHLECPDIAFSPDHPSRERAAGDLSCRGKATAVLRLKPTSVAPAGRAAPGGAGGGRRGSEKEKAPPARPSRLFAERKIPATSYSPTRSP